MARPWVSTGGVLPPPICLLCGVEIRRTDNSGIPQSMGRVSELEKRDWKRLWKPRPRHCIIPSHEAEGLDIDRFPLLWSCLYRALIKDSDTRYHLTGISSVKHLQGPYYAVKDPTKARITGRQNTHYNTHMFTQFYAAHLKRQPEGLKGKSIGFVIHAHCWALFDQVEDLGLKNTNLAKLVRICRKYWRENNEGWGVDKYDEKLCASPLLVTAIQQAMASAKTNCYHSTSRLDVLPLELRILISEFICPVTDYTKSDVQNLSNMVLGIGWELPRWFWQKRLDESLFFELGRYRKDPLADLKMRLELMSAAADQNRLNPSCLANRERILGIILAFRGAYKSDT